MSASKLFCSACREEISCKKSVINSHIKSTKHSNGKERLLRKCQNEKTIADALKSYDSGVHPVGETLPESTRVYRVKVVSSFLKAGIPLAKLDDLRELFKENGHSLTSSTHLRQVLPFILREEMLNIKEEISGKPVSIIFDGTTHVAEAFAVVIRFLDGWNVKQRLCGLKFMAKSLLGEEVARLLVSTELGISSSLIIAAMHDRASVNAVAMRTLSKLTADRSLTKQLDLYVAKIRPALEGSESNLLFPNKDGKAIDHLSRHVQNLATKLGIKLPRTATATRHAAATAAALCGEVERTTVAAAMSLQADTGSILYPQ